MVRRVTAAPRLAPVRGQLLVPYWMLGVMLIAAFLTAVASVLAVQEVRGVVQSAETSVELQPTPSTAQQEASPAPAVRLQIESLREQVAQLEADLERARRDSQALRSQAMEQSSNLDQTKQQLQTEEQRHQQELNEVQARLGTLEQQVQGVSQASEDLRALLRLPPAPTASGGPAVPNAEAANDPWLVMRSQIVATEQEVAALRAVIDEASRRVDSMLATVRASGLPQGAPADDVRFYFQMPLGEPVSGVRSSGFGYRSSPFVPAGSESSESDSGDAAPQVVYEYHTGIDLAVPLGTEVRATGGGTVTIAGPYGGYGNLVVIDHGRGVTTWYGHNSRILVSSGQRVEPGQVIAHAGSTGRSTGPHVHYEVRINGRPIDPSHLMTMSR